MLKIYLILLCLLSVRFGLFYAALPTRQDGQSITLQGVLVKEPVVSKGSYVLEIEDVRAYVPVKEVYHYGDLLIISGTLNCYDILRCSRGTIIEPEVKVLDRSRLKPRISLREEIIGTYKEVLKAKEAQVLAGIVLGDNEMDRELKNDLASAGLIHLVVASGMNLTLIGGFVFALFTSFQLSKKWVVLGSSFAVIGYAILTGLEPPIVRALIMFEAVMVGGLVGRKSGGLFALIIAAYLMLWVSPGLVTSYSFLLSFAAMMGQIFVSTIKLRLPAVLESFGLVVLQNLFAVAFTTPIILFGFARFSLVSIVTNLLVTWLVELTLVLGAIAGIIGFLSIEASRIVLVPVAYLLKYFLWVVEVFGASEKFVLKVEGVDLFMAIGYYLVLGATIYYLNLSKDDRQGNR